MGVALGWIAFALAGVAAAPHPGHQPEQITYTVRYVQAEGLGWREAVFTRLKPVTRQGAATVWTVPRDATTQLLEQVTKAPAGTVLQAPKVTAFSGVAASIHSRSSRKLVTLAAWNGDDQAPQAVAAENVRVGWHTTMVGRKLDQGILVQIVLEDTEIRAIHHLNIAGATESRRSVAQTPTVSESPVVIKGAGTFYTYQWKAKKTEVNEEKCDESETCCQMDKDQNVHKVSVDVPEIGSQEVAGEWLIPSGEFLLVSFGAYTVADEDGKAVVKERLAIIGAEEAPLANAVPPASPTASPVLVSPPAAITVAPVPPTPPIAKMPLPVPVIPSRSFPQGVHADGKPADLPKLPDDEMDDSSASESSEPRPSPQTKKPIQSKPKPTTDGGTAKAEYAPPKAPSLSFSNFFPTTTPTGLQFLLPIKPFTLKLPFNQKLQIEIVGRVVADTDAP
jgi:hypothetical protein